MPFELSVYSAPPKWPEQLSATPWAIHVVVLNTKLSKVRPRFGMTQLHCEYTSPRTLCIVILTTVHFASSVQVSSCVERRAALLEFLDHKMIQHDPLSASVAAAAGFAATSDFPGSAGAAPFTIVVLPLAAFTGSASTTFSYLAYSAMNCALFNFPAARWNNQRAGGRMAGRLKGLWQAGRPRFLGSIVMNNLSDSAASMA